MTDVIKQNDLIIPEMPKVLTLSAFFFHIPFDE